MTRQKVTDPALLAQLGTSPRQKVTDPALLAQLNNEENIEDPGAYLDNLPQQEQFFNLPRSLATGVTHIGRNLHNLPHDLALSAENSVQNVSNYLSKLLGKNVQLPNPHALSNILPNDETNYAHVYGQKGEGTLLDRIVQKGVEYAPEIGALGKLAKIGIKNFPYSLTQKMAARKLDKAENIINDLNAYIPLNAALIDESRPFLPKTHATREMLQQAEEGHYPASFATQSQVGHHARDFRKSPLAAERLLAPQADELKQNMLSEIERVLRSRSHIDARYDQAADLIRGGIKDYRQYVKLRDEVYPTLKKLGIPTGLVTSLLLGKKQIKKVINTL